MTRLRPRSCRRCWGEKGAARRGWWDREGSRVEENARETVRGSPLWGDDPDSEKKTVPDRLRFFGKRVACFDSACGNPRIQMCTTRQPR